jgi:two-component system LytT family response regulator
MKTLLIDNEPALLRGLETLLKMYCPEIAVVAKAEGVESGLQAILKWQPELVFLDVEMDDGTGMDLLRKLPQRSFQVVFITAYDHYALDAFRFSAIDYLLKPVDPDELMEAVARARSAQHSHHLQDRLNVLLENMAQIDLPHKKIVLRDAENLYIVEVQEIVRCLAEGAYTRFFLDSGEEILVSKNLKGYEQLLSNYGFFRSHHAHLVNLHYLKRFSKADGGMLILRDGSELPVSSRRKAMLMEVLANL